MCCPWVFSSKQNKSETFNFIFTIIISVLNPISRYKNRLPVHPLLILLQVDPLVEVMCRCDVFENENLSAQDLDRFRVLGLLGFRTLKPCQQTRAQRNPRVTTCTSFPLFTVTGSVKVAIRDGPPSEAGPKAPKASGPSGVALMCLARKFRILTSELGNSRPHRAPLRP